ncbi:MAG: hypothetical protein HQL91_02525 [Magnetococcales bacterium]|nr:hypothetical protein [Magnetococcales bacterium]
MNRAPWSRLARIGMALWAGLMVTACSTVPEMSGFSGWFGSARTLPAELIVGRYQVDQSARRYRPLHWAVDGVLDLETPDQERRNRIDLLGSGPDRVRLRAYGPFRQVAAELITRDNRLRWVDPESRSVIEVPASSEGLHYLLGVPIPPGRFFQVIMARAEGLLPLTGQLSLEPNGVAVTTRDGEQLRLDPADGRILERSGRPRFSAAYHVVYTWPDPAKNIDGGLLMPERILVTLEKPKVRLEWIVNAWRFPLTGLAEDAFDQAVAQGFTLSRPALEHKP